MRHESGNGGNPLRSEGDGWVLRAVAAWGEHVVRKCGVIWAMKLVNLDAVAMLPNLVPLVLEISASNSKTPWEVSAFRTWTTLKPAGTC